MNDKEKLARCQEFMSSLIEADSALIEFDLDLYERFFEATREVYTEVSNTATGIYNRLAEVENA